MRFPRFITLLFVLVIAVFGVAACGDDEEETPAAPTEEAAEEPVTADDAGDGGHAGTFAVSADPDGELAFTEESATVAAGHVTVEFDNPASLPHDVVIEDQQGKELARTEVISQDTASAEAELEPGEYTFYCSVDGHREAGMEGTLKVE